MTGPHCLGAAFVGIALLGHCAVAAEDSKSDRAKEKRWEEQIIPDLFIGEAVKLKAGHVEFLALYTEADSDDTAGAVVILHGIGAHPAWPEVIEPLRSRLPNIGWHTLSLQMPILENEAENKDYPPLFDEVPQRVQAGIDFLKSKGIDNIAVLGHSMGATMAAYYLAVLPDPAVHACIALGSGTGYPDDPRMNSLELFRRITVPVLDMFGSNDFDWVKSSAGERSDMFATADSTVYTKVQIEGANHFYIGREDLLIGNVSAWLNANAAAR